MSGTGSPEDDAERNGAFWDASADEYQAVQGRQLDAVGAGWGVWQIPEAELAVLGDVTARDVLELGCGAAQFSIELARRGARMIGLDVSQRQLDHAAGRVTKAGVAVRLVHASADDVPLPSDTLDIVFGDHGAMGFADPYRTVPEAARLLRDDGLLAFSMFTPLAEACWPPGGDGPVDQLVSDYFGMHRVDLGHADHVEFQLPYGEWIRLFVANGFVVEELVELRPGPGATSTYIGADAREWGSRWPLEHAWKVRRRR